MNVERVDSTEYIQDSLQRPGARIRPAIDLKYITYGFAYLQDMLDQLIITEHSGRQDPPGVFLQQFPYPCYVEDRYKRNSSIILLNTGHVEIIVKKI